jgi:hypothetical protein
MRWFGWIVVALSWMVTAAVVISTISQLLPPSGHEVPAPKVAAAAARVP